jgi:hypothetical protein
MKIRFKFLYISVIALFLSLFSGGAQAVSTISVSEIKPGMKGYGLTVFKGTEPERFDVEVISVVPNFLLRQDIILIRCSHPETDRAGVIGGMSGSPIYLEGRLAGALAYGWQFNKDPIAGVTPIENMLAVLKRAPRMHSNFFKRKRTLIGLNPRAPSALDKAADGFFGLFSKNSSETLLPAKTPLSIGGFSVFAQKLLGDAVSDFGLEPMTGGGASAAATDGPSTFKNGSAIGVQLIRGDMSATGIGTVTLVDGRNVLAFGHPMFNLGEGYFPVTTAEIHTVIASLSRSNKLGSPLRVAGSLVQDRPACIAARTDLSADMIPMTITVNDPRSRRRDTYRVETASHRLLTPKFVQVALANVIDDAASDAADVTAEIKGVMKISGRPAITLFDAGASRTGMRGLAPYFRPVALVQAVLDNPFEEVTVESLDFDITLRYGLEAAVIFGAYITAENPKPGETVNVYVRLRKFGDKEQLVTVPVTIPAAAAGKTVEVEVAGGDFVQPISAEPRNLDDAIADLKRLYPSKSLVVKLDAAQEGVAMHGRVLDQLPPSALNALKPSSGFDRFERFETELTRVTKTPYLVEGRQSFKISVADRRPR